MGFISRQCFKVAFMKNTTRGEAFVFCPLPTKIKHRARRFYRSKTPCWIFQSKMRDLRSRTHTNTKNVCARGQLSEHRLKQQMQTVSNRRGFGPLSIVICCLLIEQRFDFFLIHLIPRSPVFTLPASYSRVPASPEVV